MSEETKPHPEKYGWHNQQGFDDEPSRWMVEGGEEAYNEAVEKWKFQQASEWFMNLPYDEMVRMCKKANPDTPHSISDKDLITIWKGEQKP